MRKLKDGKLVCKMGYPIGSNTGFKKCPNCPNNKSNDKGCILCKASSDALKMLSSFK